MNKRWMAATGLAGLLSVWSSAAAASAPETHDGFFFQGNIGPGYLSTSPSTDGSDVDMKISGFGVGGGLLFGGTPAPGLVIGGGTANVVALSPKVTVEGEELGELDDTNLQLSTLGVFGTFYPDPQQGLSLHLMLAYAVLSASDSSEFDDDDDASANGVAITAGVGYEFWVASEWSIGVFGRFTYGALKNSENDVDWSYPTIAPALLATFTYH
jgi:hypothetical protein